MVSAHVYLLVSWYPQPSSGLRNYRQMWLGSKTFVAPLRLRARSVSMYGKLSYNRTAMQWDGSEPNKVNTTIHWECKSVHNFDNTQ